jgi:glycosyltransferase involved in cell wall biosynthesis
VLQGSVLPQLELLVMRAARAAGHPIVLVAHEATITRRSPGEMSALVKLVRSADLVITHSHFVADELARRTRRSDIDVVPLPLPLGLLDLVGTASSVLTPRDEPVALNFGNLHRGYKGTTTVLALAERGVPGWHFALVGKGASDRAGRVETVGRFLDPGELVATVAQSDATLLPYSRASQSAAVVLAQALGSAVIASAVGGIPEQIEHGVTGLLVSANAPVDSWIEALLALSDPVERARLAAAALLSVQRAHERFAARIAEVPA